MEPEHQQNVAAAFEMLLQEIESAIDRVAFHGAEALRRRAFEEARRHSEEAERLTAFRDKVSALRGEWTTNPPAGRAVRSRPAPAPERPAHRTPKAKPTPPGLLTPQEAYVLPILTSLIELGGSAPAGEVVERVGKKVAPLLNHYDKAPVPSNPGEPKWRKRVMWTRYDLVRRGLLAANSPTGIWEVTAEGRAYAAQHAS